MWQINLEEFTTFFTDKILHLSVHIRIQIHSREIPENHRTNFGILKRQKIYRKERQKNVNYCVTSGTGTTYGKLVNFGVLSLMSEMVTINGIVFLLPVDKTVQITYNREKQRFITLGGLLKFHVTTRVWSPFSLFQVIFQSQKIVLPICPFIMKLCTQWVGIFQAFSSKLGQKSTNLKHRFLQNSHF